MLGIAQFEGKRETYTDSLPGSSDDSCLFGLPSQMELAVSWNGRERSFAVVEFSVDELVVVDFRVSDIDLCAHEASIDYCDDELIDEVTCRVVFRGFVGVGLARLRIIAEGHERTDVARLSALLRERFGRDSGRARA
ncbi:MAG TPA: hypothetical protein VM869_09725 [Enhygromyxa sp.]|nr:hypothetical protein [Enhygromyxa sp.]